jgi:hypothetical protein
MPWGERSSVESAAPSGESHEVTPVSAVAPTLMTAPVTAPPLLTPEQWAGAPNSQIARRLAEVDLAERLRSAARHFIGRQEGRLMALADNVVDLVISVPYRLLDGVDAAVDAVSTSAGLADPDRENLRAGMRQAFVTAAPLLEKLREQSMAAGLYDEATGTPSVKPLVARGADLLDRAVSGGAPAEETTGLTDREWGQLQGEAEGQLAMMLSGAKPVKLFLDVLDGVGSVNAILAAVRTAKKSKGDAWTSDRDVWLSILTGVLTMAGFMDVSAGRKLLEHLIEAAMAATPIAQAAATLSDRLNDPHATDAVIAADAKTLAMAIAAALRQVMSGGGPGAASGTPATGADAPTAAGTRTTAADNASAAVGAAPRRSVAEEAAARHITEWDANRKRTGKEERQGTFGPALERAHEADLEEHGHQMRNMNDLVAKNAPAIDLWGTDGAISTKAVSIGKKVLDIPRIYQYLKELRGPNHTKRVDDIATQIDIHRNELLAKGEWPADLARSAGKDEIAEYIRTRGKLSIATTDEELATIRDHLREKITNSPGAVGLDHDTATPEQIESVVNSVVSAGMSRDQLHQVNRKALGLE